MNDCVKYERLPMKKSSAYSAPALSRGLQILEILSTKSDPMTTHEIASELGRNRNEIFRVIAVLEAEGYLKKGHEGIGYALSGKLLMLGLSSPEILDIFDAVSPLAAELSATLGAPCHLALPSQDEMIVIKRWEPKLRLSINVPVATRRALEITGSGIVMLCSMTPAELDSSLDLIKARSSSFRLKDLEPYKKKLKANGVLLFDSKLMDGVVDLSVPLTSKGGQLHGALTCPYANNATCDANIEEISNALFQIANKISNMLIRS